MDRPGPISFVIPVATAGAALVTAWSNHNMQLTIGGYAIGYASCAVLAVGAYAWQLRAWKKHKAEEDAKEERQKIEEVAKEERRRAAESERDRLRNDLLVHAIVESHRMIRAEALQESKNRHEADEAAIREWDEYDCKCRERLKLIIDNPGEDYFRGNLYDPFGNEKPEAREALDQFLVMKAAGQLIDPPPPPVPPKSNRPLTSADPRFPQSPTRDR